MSIDIRVYNADLELQGVIDEFSSLIWIRRYQTPGEFELHTPYSEESRTLLVPNNLIQRFDDKSVLEAGVIEYLQMNHDEIIVKGRFLESYLDRRVMALIGTYYYTGKVNINLYEIVYDFCIKDTVPEYVIPHLYLGSMPSLDETLDFEATLKTVLSVVSRACRATALGFRIRPDFEHRWMLFELYKGTDRTADSASKVIFSETYDNLTNETYTYDNTNYKTVAYASQLFNGERETFEVDPGGGTAGFLRRELLVSTNVESDGKSQQEIWDLMTAAANRAIENHKEAETFTFSTDAEGTFKYRTDYDLGDLVIINHIAWGIYQTRRIMEVEEDYQNGYMNVILTCGDPLPETIDFKEGY